MRPVGACAGEGHSRVTLCPRLESLDHGVAPGVVACTANSESPPSIRTSLRVSGDGLFAMSRGGFSSTARDMWTGSFTSPGRDDAGEFCVSPHFRPQTNQSHQVTRPYPSSAVSRAAARRRFLPPRARPSTGFPRTGNRAADPSADHSTITQPGIMPCHMLPHAPFAARCPARSPD